MRKLARRAAAVCGADGCGSGLPWQTPSRTSTGYWSGNGSIALTNGKTERVKCQVIYKTGGGTQIRQTMRCASADYSINSLADLRVKGGQVSGSWEEKTYSAKGDVIGPLRR